MSRSSPAAVALVLREETFVAHPYYDGGLYSGVALPYGYDLGQHDEATFRRHWGRWQAPGDVDLLCAAIGVRGHGAGALLLASHLDAIPVTRAAAQEVFADDSLPRYEAELIGCMPGAEKLGPDAFGALTDLVYNRGPAMDDAHVLPGDRRLEMREIRSIVAAYAATELTSSHIAFLLAIADKLEHMGDRVWPPDVSKENDTLRQRRHDEANLVRASAGRSAAP